MDIHCATCREPWDHYHMREDEIWEIWDGIDDSPTHLMCKKFLADPRRTLTKEIREALSEKGWEFGATIYSILRCCCCASNEAHNGPDDNEKIEYRKEARLLLEELLGDDHDGLISEINTFGDRDPL